MLEYLAHLQAVHFFNLMASTTTVPQDVQHISRRSLLISRKISLHQSIYTKLEQPGYQLHDDQLVDDGNYETGSHQFSPIVNRLHIMRRFLMMDERRLLWRICMSQRLITKVVRIMMNILPPI